MSQIAEELTFAVLSDTKFEISRCFWDFLEVSQEAKVAPLLCRLVPLQCYLAKGGIPKMPLFWDHFDFFFRKFLKSGDIVSQISLWIQCLQKTQSIPRRSKRKMLHQENTSSLDPSYGV